MPATYKTIFLVIEQGAGIIKKAFERYDIAEQYVKRLEEQTGFDCYEIQPVTYQF